MRDCGTCIACCTFLDIKTGELKPCQYLDVKDLRFVSDKSCAGCTVYGNRPQCCRDFRCDYLLGRVDEAPGAALQAWIEDIKAGKLTANPPKLQSMITGEE